MGFTLYNAFSDQEIAVLNNKSSYKLYEISNPNDPALMRGQELTNAIESASLEPNGFKVTLNLNQLIDREKSYMLKVLLKSRLEKPIAFDPDKKAEISSLVKGGRKNLEISSNVPIKNSTDEKVKLTEKYYKIDDNNDKLIVVERKYNATTKQVGNKEFGYYYNLELDKRLSEGVTHNLQLEDGFEDPKGNKVKAEGKLEVPGLPKAADTPKFDIKLAAATAGKQKPSFDFDSTLTFPQKRFLNTNFNFFPKLEFDLGLGETQSKNALIAGFYFTTYKDFKYKRPDQSPPPTLKNRQTRTNSIQNSQVAAANNQDITLPKYSNWKNQPVRINYIDYFIGPKVEISTGSRFNGLINFRTDFLIYRFNQTISDKRENLTPDLETKGIDSKLVKISRGFKFVPHFSIEAGRKFSAEVIEIKDKGLRDVIEPHNIFRTYGGFTSMFELNYSYLPLKVSVEGNLIHFAVQETIGSSTDAGFIDRRKIKGFHHNGKISFDFGLDPAKRYTFNITYENGRWAPNLEYFNKISAGIHLSYDSLIPFLIR